MSPIAAAVEKTIGDLSARVGAGESLAPDDAALLLTFVERATAEVHRCDAAIAEGIEALARFRRAAVPTLDEERVLLKLGEAWDGYTALPIYHSGELEAFRGALLRCQQLIAIRVARRVDPGTWSAGA